jgi:IS4 transposase
MSEKLDIYLTDYARRRIGVYKKYMLAVLDKSDRCISFLESMQRTTVSIADLKNCEFLRDTEIFIEDKVFCGRAKRVQVLYFDGAEQTVC